MEAESAASVCRLRATFASLAILLDENTETLDRFVPLARNAIELVPCLRERTPIQRPERHPSRPFALRKAGRLEDAEVLRHGLARDVRALRQMGDGERPMSRKARDQGHALRIAQRREYGSRSRQPGHLVMPHGRGTSQ